MPEVFPELDLREQLAKIDNLREGALKFTTEQRKLAAEAAKFQRERWLMPWTLLVGLAGGIGLGIAQIVIKHLGW